MSISKNLRIEFRNKYTDKIKHYHICSGEHEVRLCDDLITFSCNLPKARHEVGVECKKCVRRLGELLSEGKVTKKGVCYEIDLKNINKQPDPEINAA